MDSNRDQGSHEPPTDLGDALYPLDAYRDQRVQKHVLRAASERATATGNHDHIATGVRSASESPRRRTALREVSMRSAFEYVNYNMPETVTQEVVARRQIARDMADPGIHSDGPRFQDIIHFPPRHATLLHPGAVARSSRDILLSRDRALAADPNLAPLPRPYVPQGASYTSPGPYQYDRKGTRQANAVLNDTLLGGRVATSPAADNAVPNNMSLAEVNAAADHLNRSETDLTISQNDILATLRDLQQRMHPTESLMRNTRIQYPVRRLVDFPERRVALFARDMLTNWREIIRADSGRDSANPPVETDPFMEENTTGLCAAPRRVPQDGTAAHPFVLDADADADATNNDGDIPSTISDTAGGQMPVGNQSFNIFQDDPSPERSERSVGNNILQSQRPHDLPTQSIEAGGLEDGLCHECPDFPGTYHHICDGNPLCAASQGTCPMRDQTSPSYGPSRSPQPAQGTAPGANGGTDITSLGNTTFPTNHPPHLPGDIPDPFVRNAAGALDTQQASPDLGNPGQAPTAWIRDARRPRDTPVRTPGSVLGNGGRDTQSDLRPFTPDLEHIHAQRPKRARLAADGPSQQTQPAGSQANPVFISSASNSPSNGATQQTQGVGSQADPISFVSPTSSAFDDAFPQTQPVGSQANPIVLSPFAGPPPLPTYADYATASRDDLLAELFDRNAPPLSGAPQSHDRVIRLLMFEDLRGNTGSGVPAPAAVSQRSAVTASFLGPNGSLPVTPADQILPRRRRRAAVPSSQPTASSAAPTNTSGKRMSAPGSNGPSPKRSRASNDDGPSPKGTSVPDDDGPSPAASRSGSPPTTV